MNGKFDCPNDAIRLSISSRVFELGNLCRDRFGTATHTSQLNGAAVQRSKILVKNILYQ